MRLAARAADRLASVLLPRSRRPEFITPASNVQQGVRRSKLVFRVVSVGTFGPEDAAKLHPGTRVEVRLAGLVSLRAHRSIDVRVRGARNRTRWPGLSKRFGDSHRRSTISPCRCKRGASTDRSVHPNGSGRRRNPHSE